MIAGKVFLILVGAFIIFMSIDVFSMGESVILLIGGFLISSLPGIALIIFVWYFWKRELFLGIITLVLNTGFLILFQFLSNIPESLPMIFAMIIPLYAIGILFVLEGKKR